MVDYHKGTKRAMSEIYREDNWPITCFGPLGLSPDVHLCISLEKRTLKYKVLGDFAKRLSESKIRPEGSCSQFNDVTLPEIDRRNKQIPFDATEYALLYPLPDLGTAGFQQFAAIFGANCAVCPVASALRYGAFVYLDKAGKILRINAIMEDDPQATGFFIFQGPFFLPKDFKAQKMGIWQEMHRTAMRQKGVTHYAWISPDQSSEIVAPHGAFVFLFEDSSQDRYFRLANHNLLTLSSAEDDRLSSELEDILKNSAGFAMGYPATNKDGRNFSLQNEVPFPLRVTSALLVALGRNPNDKFTIVKTGKGHYEYTPDEPEPQGLRSVSLSAPLHTLKEPIQWNVKNVEKWLRKWYTDPLINECLAAVKVSSLEEIYGTGDYTISPQQLYQYEQSTRITVGEALTPYFYRSLLSLTADNRYIQYFWETKSSPLAEFLKPVAEQEHSLQSNPIARDLMTALLQKVIVSPVNFGYKKLSHVKATLELSLTELSSMVVISQEGQFLLGNYNQIAAPTLSTQPILFLATAAIDFDDPDRNAAAGREEARYFEITERHSDGRVEGKWKSPGARQAFKDRIKIMYDMLFRRCSEAGVTHPSFLPIGLGAFLPRIEAASVKSIYHEAQFELLCENNYNFQCYFLNPGPGRKEAEEILSNYTFLPEVVLHTKNGKFLAAELARAGYRTCCLNPSDCIAMMNGCMGYWWEVGKGTRYVGEEDIVSTSTLVLASKGISTVFDSARIQQHEG